MRKIFADASYWLALANPKDHWSAAAERATAAAGDIRLVTTDEALTEFLNFYAAYGKLVRRQVSAMARTILEDPGIAVIEQSHDRFLDGLDFYERRFDKGYSLTDCIAMRVMSEEGIDEALTTDRR